MSLQNWVQWGQVSSFDTLIATIGQTETVSALIIREVFGRVDGVGLGPASKANKNEYNELDWQHDEKGAPAIKRLETKIGKIESQIHRAFINS